MTTQVPRARSRPRPTVIQGGQNHDELDGVGDRQARVSYSSGSSSSHPASGESWFQVSQSITSSRTSHSSHAPLPKGARAPSPQPAQQHFQRPRHGHGSPHHGSRSHSRSASRKRRTRSASFSWRIDWRGVSKVVKWAVFGEQPPPRRLASKGSKRRTPSPPTHSHSKPRNHSSRRAYNREARSNVQQVEPTHSSKPLPSEPVLRNADHKDGFARPSHSSSSVHLPHGNPTYPTSHSKLDAEHEFNRTGNVAGSLPFPNPSHFQASLPAGTSRQRHGSISASPSWHVSRNSFTSNVHSERGHALSELGHSEPEEADPDARYTVSDIGHSSFPHLLNSSPALPYAPGRQRYARSDLGHSITYAMPSSSARSQMSSSAVFNDLDRPMSLYTDAKYAASESFRYPQFAPVSSLSRSIPPTFENRRPRKLRKNSRGGSDGVQSIRSSEQQSYYGSSRIASSSTSNYTSVASTLAYSGAPPSKPRPKPARKLTKRNSAPLPPLSKPLPYGDGSSELVPPPLPSKAHLNLKLQVPSHPSIPAKLSLDANRHSPPVKSASSSEAADTSHDGMLVSSPASMTSVSQGCAGTISPSQRPSFLRSESNRRWTIAVADVPDDMLVAELDRLRKMGMRAGDVHGVRPVFPYSEEMIFETQDAIAKGMKKSTITSVEEVEEDEIEWGYARRAILCCRELVRTERSYQARLQDLFDGNVSDEVPSLILKYLPNLISASRLLSSLFSEDPSAVGVSTAFMEAEPALENAFVAWTSVVGEFFAGEAGVVPVQNYVRSATVSHVTQHEQQHFSVDELGRNVKTTVRSMSLQEHKEVERLAFATSASSSSGSSPSQSRSNSQNRRHTSFSNGKSMHWLLRSSLSPPSSTPSSSSTSDGRESFSFSLRKSFGRSSRKPNAEKRRRPPFRELAILPTQRVTRYVLLYKDLLKHTPLTSPARGLVERAVSCAQILAQKCDRAQGNAAFLYSS